MKIISEFRTFIQRGNVLDMAVGVIIGNAFGKIVSSISSDIIMPPIGILVGGVDLAKMKLRIGEDANGPIFWNYGNFLQTTLDFLIIAAVVFFVVKLANYVRDLETKIKLPNPFPFANASEKDSPSEPVPAPAPAPVAEDVKLLTEIRDLLKEKKG